MGRHSAATGGRHAAASGGRHAGGRRTRRARRRARPGVVLTVLAVLAVVGAGGAWWVRGGRIAVTPAASTCTAPRHAAISVAPAMSAVATDVAQRVTAHEPCLVVDVVSAAPAAVAAALSGEGTSPDAWISDSTSWVDAVRAARPERLGADVTHIAVSPLVLAVPSSVTAIVHSAVTAATWPGVLDGTTGLPLTLTDPDSTTSGRLLLVTTAATLGSRSGQTTLAPVLLDWSHRTAPTEAALFAAIDSPAPRVFPTSEQAVARYRAQHPGLVSAVIPKGGTPAFDYSFVASTTLDAGSGRAVDAFRAELGSTETRAELAAAGFRDDERSDGAEVTGVTAGAVTYLTLPSASAQKATLTTWRSVRTDSRMLALLDISGSMLEPAGKGTRMQLVTAAAAVAVAALPGSTELGAWAFGVDVDGPGRDWTPISPVARLDTFTGGVSHRDRLTAVLPSLNDRARGGTGLYDSVLGAYEAMQSGYESGRVNSVVVLTDGRNDDPQGIDLAQLLAELGTRADPGRPIVVVTIGMGPDVDTSALKAIAAATGGRSYVATDPAQIQGVLIDAILSRTCTVAACAT